jgi:CubicO group peptidase (beta-lactamase class C family)
VRLIILVTCCVLTTSCGSGSSDNVPPSPGASSDPLCSVDELEDLIDATLSQTPSEVDFSFSVEREDGRRYVFNRGLSTLQTSYESASTSKLVSVVIILRLVELGYLSLTDRPQDYIIDWPVSNGDPLYNMNLAQLLSFTSGLETSPGCLNLGPFNFETCVNNVATRNAGNGIVPGESFYYSSAHLQVAGLMAYKAFGGADWQEVFFEFKLQTGLFSSSAFDLPSSSNPRLAGGMHWSGEEYMAFLLALRNGEILNADSMAVLLTDHTADVSIAHSPVFDALMEDWHYGLGLWHECESTVFNCNVPSRVSSPGAYGSYPFWDHTLDYVGLVARQGALGTFTNGIIIERAVRNNVERWAVCD